MDDSANAGGDGGGEWPPPSGKRKRFRAGLRMIESLARQPGWVENMPADTRQRVMGMLAEAVELAESVRDRASLAKAFAALERNDMDRARLLNDTEQSDEPDSAARQLLDDIDEIDRIEGRNRAT